MLLWGPWDAGLRFGCSGIGHELDSVIANGPAPLIAVVLPPDRSGAARRS